MKNTFTREEVIKMLDEVAHSNWRYELGNDVTWETDNGNIATDELIEFLIPEKKDTITMTPHEKVKQEMQIRVTEIMDMNPAILRWLALMIAKREVSLLIDEIGKLPYSEEALNRKTELERGLEILHGL